MNGKNSRLSVLLFSKEWKTLSVYKQTVPHGESEQNHGSVVQIHTFAPVALCMKRKITPNALVYTEQTSMQELQSRYALKTRGTEFALIDR